MWLCYDCIMNTNLEPKQIAMIAARRAWDRLEHQHGKMVMPAIELSNRLTKTAGKCYVEENRVVLGTKFLIKFPDIMADVIIPHELCHQVDFNKNGVPKNNRWHGTTWQNIMVKYGLPPDTYHTMVL